MKINPDLFVNDEADADHLKDDDNEESDSVDEDEEWILTRNEPVLPVHVRRQYPEKHGHDDGDDGYYPEESDGEHDNEEQWWRGSGENKLLLGLRRSKSIDNLMKRECWEEKTAKRVKGGKIW